MKAYDVRFAQELVEADVPHARPRVADGRPVVHQDGAPEAGEYIDGAHADPARADDTDGFSVHVEPDQSVERVISVPHAVIGPVDMAV